MDEEFLRLNVALAEHRLDKLAVEMRDAGSSQVELYTIFSRFYQILADANSSEADMDCVLDVLDRIWGWCADDAKFFTEPLTDAAVARYQQESALSRLVLPYGWFYPSPNERAALERELQLELPAQHLLYHKPVEVIAHRRGATDDILCRHLDEPQRYTVVHLTWAMKTEINAGFPTVEADGTWQDFLNYENKFGA
jgi:hypothetical protein